MKKAEQPFRFLLASYLIRIQDVKATSIAELAEGLEKCSDASIFFHTFHSLSRNHFLTEGFSNDFAHWAMAACNAHELAEQLANLDVREYTSLGALHTELHRLVKEFCQGHPQLAAQPAFEPFTFCEAVEVTMPMKFEAWTLGEFRQGLQKLSRASLHYHFVDSRLRLRLRSNDFSNWLDTSLGLAALANRINRVDIYTATLEDLRGLLTGMIDLEMRR